MDRQQPDRCPIRFIDRRRLRSAGFNDRCRQQIAGFTGRRRFLRIGGGLAASACALPAMGGSGVGEASPAPTSGKAKSCILIYLLGGPPHLDMFDLKPEAAAEIRGPFKPIATNVPGLSICEHLPRLASIANSYALVRSVSHPNHNHTPMIYYTLTGRPVERPNQDNDVRPPQRNDAPHLGAILSRFRPAPNYLPGYIALPDVAVRTSGDFPRGWTLLRGGGAGFLGARFDPFAVRGEPGALGSAPNLSLPEEVPHERLAARASLLNVLDGGKSPIPSSTAFGDLRKSAITLMGASAHAGGQAFSLGGEPDRLRDRYGRHRFGQSLLLARRLAEAGVPMIAIHFNDMTRCDGWDTHAKNFVALEQELLPMVDEGVTALLGDLADRGMLDETIVACYGEFGRTPKINGDAGRDHWGSCSSALLAGGGIPGGLVLGASDRIGAYPISNPIDPIDIHATILHQMGLDPHQKMIDNLGRPIPLSEGRIVPALIG